MNTYCVIRVYEHILKFRGNVTRTSIKTGIVGFFFRECYAEQMATFHNEKVQQTIESIKQELKETKKLSEMRGNPDWMAKRINRLNRQIDAYNNERFIVCLCKSADITRDFVNIEYDWDDISRQAVKEAESLFN